MLWLSEGVAVKQKLQEWALVAEIIGSVALVVSLIYVGYEIRQNSEQVRVANRQSIASRVEQLTLASGNNPRLWGLVEGEDPDNLPISRLRQMYNFNGAFYRNIEEAYLMYLEGQLSEEYWLTRAPFAVSKMTDPDSPHTYHWYQLNKHAFTPRFTMWLDDELRKAGISN